MNLANLRLGLAVWLVLALLTSCLQGWDEVVAADSAFGHPAFETIYNRVDGAAVRGVTRPLIWGETPLSVKTERWDNAPTKTRTVQYFAKGKMELNEVAGGTPVVTFGRMAFDLATGAKMVGESRLQAYDPSILPVYGDLNPLTNPAPRYADFTRDVFGVITTNAVGREIITVIRNGRRFTQRNPRAEPKVRNAYYEIRSGHNIAEPFWTFFNATGQVATPSGSLEESQLFSWQEVVGYPLSEPYWMNYLQNGNTTEALVQLFEKRVMVFIPNAPDGATVQFNDVGAHYLSWAYDPYPGVGNQDTSVPESTNGKTVPTYGGLNTIFRLFSSGYKAGERVNYNVVQPDGSVVSGRFLYTTADANGNTGFLFYGLDFTPFTGSYTGVYQINLTGLVSKKTATIYFRVLDLPPETPTKPYTVPSDPVPPSINAQVEPNSGSISTLFVALLNGIYDKDFLTPEGRTNCSLWYTDPDGVVYPSSCFATLGVDDSPFGTIIGIGSPPAPGLWAVTIQIRSNPNKKAIIYLRVTDEPYELDFNFAFNFNRSGTSTRAGTGVFSNVPFVQVERPQPDNQDVIEGEQPAE
jgi:hypothetical protein